ncbi:YceI family protein [Parabacteroides sp. FAFU027]|uniref:YceI family protein n=1 Tax=Parabacteroides sp. FAFU027 TaxID=2922715 RepID=UPI001FAFA725|nr:YceI family protein [Parabacteroides sp. FAFU027]
MKKLIALTIVLFALTTITLSAQENYEMAFGQSSMKILGTSTLHDWHMDVTKFSGKAKIASVKESVIQATSAMLSVHVQDIKSEHKAMDKIAYDALKYKTSPDINFVLHTIKKSIDNAGSFKGTASGLLAIAGVKKEVSFPVDGQYLADGSVKLVGKAALRMTEFGIKPPTAVLGTIKTGDNIQIEFSLLFKKL